MSHHADFDVRIDSWYAYACARVDAFGFFVESSALREAGRARSGARMRNMSVRYHYWEEASYDAAATVPERPWTFPSHDYAIESARLRHMAECGLLRLRQPSRDEG